MGRSCLCSCRRWWPHGWAGRWARSAPPSRRISSPRWRSSWSPGGSPRSLPPPPGAARPRGSASARDPAGRGPAGGPRVGELLRLVGSSLAQLFTSLIPQIIAAGVLIPIIVPYLLTVRGLDERELLVLMVLVLGTGLLLLAPAGRIGDRLGRRPPHGLGLAAGPLPVIPA